MDRVNSRYKTFLNNGVVCFAVGLGLGAFGGFLGGKSALQVPTQGISASPSLEDALTNRNATDSINPIQPMEHNQYVSTSHKTRADALPQPDNQPSDWRSLLKELSSQVNQGRAQSQRQWLRSMNQLSSMSFEDQLKFLKAPSRQHSGVSSAQFWLAGYLGETYPDKTLEILASLPEQNQQDLLFTLVDGWSKHDPEAVWDWMENQGLEVVDGAERDRSTLQFQTLFAMAQRPELVDKAIQLAKENSEKNRYGPNANNLLFGVADAVALRDPQLAIEIANTSDDTEGYFISAAFRQFVSQDPDKAAEMIEDFPDRLKVASFEVGQFLSDTFERSPEQFTELMGKLPDHESKLIAYQNVLNGINSPTSNQRTLDVVASVSPSDPLYKNVVGAAIHTIQRLPSFEQASELLQSMNSDLDWGQHGESIGYELKSWYRRQPNEVMDFMEKHFPNNDATYQNVWQGFNNVEFQEPSSFQQVVNPFYILDQEERRKAAVAEVGEVVE